MSEMTRQSDGQIKLLLVNETLLMGNVIAAAMVQRLSSLAHKFSSIENSVANPAALASREIEVLKLIGRGLTNQQIAEHLVIEVGTVKNHVHSILEKLNVSSRKEAAAYLAVIKR